MHVIPPSARFTTEDFGDLLKISIPSRKGWFQILFLGCWLVGWAFGEVTALGFLINGKGGGGFSWFLIAWLGGWTLVGLWAIYTFLWQIAGKEIISVSSQSITIKMAVLYWGFPKEYSVEYIKDLRISPVTSGNDLFGWSRASNFWGRGNGIIAFDYGAQTFHCGSGVDEAEAKQIISTIQQRFPQYRNRQVQA